MRREDLPLLAAWLQQPHVSEWWRGEPHGLAAVEAKYGPCIDGDDPTDLFVVEADGRPVGMAQCYRIADEPEWARVFDGIVEVSDAAGIDYLIGVPDATGRGIGTAMVAAMVPLVFERLSVASIVVTVQPANVASWKALERAGFRRCWSGELDSPDPSDTGPQHVYVIDAGE
jgi:aminoglycoside 6'-N-acetyltransferase